MQLSNVARSSMPQYPMLMWPHARFANEIVVTDWVSGTDIALTGTLSELDALNEALWRCDGNHVWADIQAVSGAHWTAVLDAFQALVERHAVVDRHDRAESLLAQLHGRGNVSRKLLEEIVNESRWRDRRVDPGMVSSPGVGLRSGPLMRPHSTPFRDSFGWQQVKLPAIHQILINAYGSDETWKPVPSAGRMWPLTIHVAVRDENADEYELMWFDDENHGLLCAKRRLKTEDLIAVLVQGTDMRMLLEAGSAMLLISAHLARSARKYGNRAVAYALIEAGALLQQVSLYAAQLRISCRPLGGIRNNLARELVGDEPEPLMAILLSGYPSTESTSDARG